VVHGPYQADCRCGRTLCPMFNSCMSADNKRSVFAQRKAGALMMRSRRWCQRR
jgi:hypothetical protein